MKQRRYWPHRQHLFDHWRGFAVAGDTAYAAAKAGMVGFTRAVALEAARLSASP